MGPFRLSRALWGILARPVGLVVANPVFAGAKSVFLTDGPGATDNALVRGYTAEVLGAPVIMAAGVTEKYYKTQKVKYKSLNEHRRLTEVEFRALVATLPPAAKQATE